MPTYDYVCQSCEHAFELFQQITAPVKRKCPECGTLKLKRLIGTGAGIIFKGSGFYETDYRSDSYKKAAEADKKTSADSKDKSSEKSSDGSAKADSSKKPDASKSGTKSSSKAGSKSTPSSD